VMRCAIQHAHRQIETGESYGIPLAQCEGIFREIALHVSELKHEAFFYGDGVRIGSGAHHGWVWNNSQADSALSQAFNTLVFDNYGQKPCTPTSEEVAALIKGAQLLECILPRSAESALSHVHSIVLFPPVGNWLRISSSSEFRLGGTVFLNRKHIMNPWWVAEHLYHEALHQQLYDFRHGHSLLNPDFDREEAPRVCSLWNSPNLKRGNYWDAHRSMAAFHVYVHLSLLCVIVDELANSLASRFGDGEKVLVGTRKALDRARYLAEQLQNACGGDIGQAGKKFTQWFTSVLDVLDDSPAPTGACTHLLLDRYRREAQKVDNLIGESQSNSDFRLLLRTLVENELTSAHRILEETDACVNEFAAKVEDFKRETAQSHFSAARSFIADSLINASQNKYELSTSHVPDEMLREMVETSSERLMPYLST
jgi:hypothetical protein